MASSTERKSSAPMIVGAVLGTLLFAGATYAVVDVAGGTDVSPDYSNTPNGVTPSAPEFGK